MLTKESNELLTRVGPGTAMGALLRQYWLPALLSSELAERDGRPLRVRLLGEALVAFRDSDGRVGLLSEFCPHRRVSLYFGRNEERGLRCVYHGWKFDVQGRCVDLPSEPPESKMCSRVRTTAYRCEERGGVIWAYMGPGEAPPLPQFEWALVPEQNRYMSKRLLECNWAQALEGDIDSSHASFLHAMLDPADYAIYERPQRALYMGRDGHPRYEVVDTDYGMMFAARRDAEPDSYYWRVAQYVLPFVTMPAPYEDTLYRCNIWVPMDDEHTMVHVVDWHPARALQPSEIASRDTGLTAHCREFEPASAEAGGAWRPKVNAANDYLIDVNRQRTSNFSGIREIWAQDKAVVEAMGPILDRSHEHLGSSDAPITRWRSRVMSEARALRDEGRCAPPPVDGAFVRPASFVLRRGEDWREVASKHAAAAVGTPPHPETV